MDPDYLTIPEQPTPEQLRALVIHLDKRVRSLERSLKRLREQARDFERVVDERITRISNVLRQLERDDREHKGRA